MEEEIEKEIEERKKRIINLFLNKKSLLIIAGLVVLLIMSWHVRTINVPNLKDITTGDYTLGPDLDPFLFLRYAKYIVENGSLMSHDTMRYVPLGYNTAKETRLLPYMIAYFHYFLNIFKKTSVNYSAVIFPAFMFLLTAMAFFLFIGKVFEKSRYKNWIALLSTLLLIISPSLVSRTVAGIPEKESVGFLFMFLAFYFFIWSWQEKNKKALLLALLAGISTALMGLIWGGWIYIFTTVAIFSFIAFICNKFDRTKFFSYSIWLFSSFIIVLLFSERYSLSSLVQSSSTGLSAVVFSFLLVDFFIFNTKIKNFKLVRDLREKVPERILSILFTLVIGFAVFSFSFGMNFFPDFIKEIYLHLKQPYYDRLSFTVAENRQPYFSDWKGSFGPAIKGFPLFFWLFFLGSIFLFYDAVKNADKKRRLIFTLIFTIFLFALIFSRYSSKSTLNGENFVSRFLYLGSFFLLLISGIYIYYFYYKQKELVRLENLNFPYLFILSFFLVSIIGARSAIRLIMVLSVPSCAIISYFGITLIKKIKNAKKDYKGILTLISVIVWGVILFTAYYNYEATKTSALGMVPSSYTQQWQEAMSWVRENTQPTIIENEEFEGGTVFAHWWDYGYWVQSIGNRATILDGGNSISYWNHLLGRHVLTGQNEREALEFLYTHNATHLLIDSTEIGKYPAYSSIGSDENYDRYSQMIVMSEDEKNMRETKNGTIHYYVGGTFLDKDFLWESNGKREFFPAFKTSIVAVVLPKENDTFKQPDVIFIYDGRQYRIPLKCAYEGRKKYEFEEGYGGCLYLLPELVQTSGGAFIRNEKRALFVTEKSMNALWVKLYLFGEGKNFKLAHKEDDVIIEDLKKQNAIFGDFVYFGGIRGPIKIWQINYPEDIERREEYLSRKYPESVRMAKDIF